MLRQCTRIGNFQQNIQNLVQKKKQIPIKNMQTLSHSWTNKKNIASIINQHTEQQVSATPWLIEFYTTKFNNSSIKWDPSSSIHLNRNQLTIFFSQNISTTTSDNTVTMERIEQFFHKCFQDNNYKSNGGDNNKPQLITQGHDVNVLPITYYWYHGTT